MSQPVSSGVGYKIEAGGFIAKKIPLMIFKSQIQLVYERSHLLPLGHYLVISGYPIGCEIAEFLGCGNIIPLSSPDTAGCGP